MANFKETDGCEEKQTAIEIQNETPNSDESQLPPGLTNLNLPALDKKVIANDEEKRLVRKLDMRIIPTISVIYLFACKLYNVLQNNK